jgi:hypothetical protein
VTFIKRKRFKSIQDLVPFLLCLAVVLPQNRLLARFPWQDLIYADFQIYNRWVFFAESVKTEGLWTALTLTTNFGMNLGENMSVSSRVSSSIFDIGAWLFLTTNNLDFALAGKLLMHFVICYAGFKNLYKIAYPVNSPKRNIFFLISLASTLCHPILYHEVGPMVLWYLLLTPAWLFIFLKAFNYGISASLRSSLLYILIFLTVGSSDLFIFFFFPFIAITAYFLSDNKLKPGNLVKLLFLVEILMIIPKIPYFFFAHSPYIVSNKGTINAGQYFDEFIEPLLLKSLLFIYFTGPVLIFLNIIVLITVAYMSVSNFSKSKQYLLFLATLLVLLIGIGVVLHGIPYLRNQLPSGVRYQVAVWPFIVLAVLPFWSSKVEFKEKLKLVSNKFVSLCLLFTILIMITGSTTIYEVITPGASKKAVNLDMREWLLHQLPNCINQIISTSSRSEYSNKSFVFLTSEREGGRNDTLLFLIENPHQLNGPTFNQWTYATNKANYNLNLDSNLRGLNSWAFIENNLNSVLKFAEKSQSQYLISTVPLESKNSQFEMIGKCSFPEELVGSSTPFKSRQGNFPLGNITLESPVFIHDINSNSQGETKLVHLDEFNLSSLVYEVKCGPVNQVTLPVGYSNEIVITSGSINLETNESEHSMVTIKNYSKICANSQSIFVSVTSYSKILHLNLLMAASLLLSVIVSLALTRKSKS